MARLNRSRARMKASLLPSGEKIGDESPARLPNVSSTGFVIRRGSPPSVGTIQTADAPLDSIPLNASSLPSGDQAILLLETVLGAGIWLMDTSFRSTPP